MRSAAIRLLLGCGLIAAASVARAQEPLSEYFRWATARIEAKGLEGIDTAGEWMARRPELQRQALEMLGLDPMPARTPLNATITRTIERPDFRVEMLHYESSPGLVVTANLFLPREIRGQHPAILYVCGHSDQKKDGIIYGNKTHYNHHAAWYAANGYVCLVLDTLQLGEVPGLHHGTFRQGMWWWYSRGYTPAGIEAWNGIRGIDYLLGRPEVDPSRIGVTGRSGGGATTWWLGAIDDRIAAIVPVAGITDLRNHILDGCVQGHCDCMYFVNTYRWDYATLAALCAPKAMLLENTNRDPIFPEDGVRRVFRALETVYGWYGARERLGLLIGDGGHIDSIELRHPSFAFFERHFKDIAEPVITEPPRKLAMEYLKVLEPGSPPPDSRNATIHEAFVPRAITPPVPKDAEAWRTCRDAWIQELRGKVFGGWPDAGELVDLEVRPVGHSMPGPEQAVIPRFLTYASEPGIRCFITPESGPGQPGGPVFVGVGDCSSASHPLSWTLYPRGLDRINRVAWPESKDAQIRRRFYLLGETLDGQRVWDVRRGLAALREQTNPSVLGVRPKRREGGVTLVAQGSMAPIALFAAIFEPDVAAVELVDPPSTFADGPAFLNVEKILDMPQAAALLYPRPLTIRGKVRPEEWRWSAELARRLDPDRAWLTIEVQP
ncbi:MAG: acetylxylan esterase [Isosphaeraceae bacterium]